MSFHKLVKMKRLQKLEKYNLRTRWFIRQAVVAVLQAKWFEQIPWTAKRLLELITCREQSQFLIWRTEFRTGSSCSSVRVSSMTSRRQEWTHQCPALSWSCSASRQSTPHNNSKITLKTRWSEVSGELQVWIYSTSPWVSLFQTKPFSCFSNGSRAQLGRAQVI